MESTISALSEVSLLWWLLDIDALRGQNQLPCPYYFISLSSRNLVIYFFVADAFQHHLWAHRAARLREGRIFFFFRNFGGGWGEARFLVVICSQSHRNNALFSSYSTAITHSLLESVVFLSSISVRAENQHSLSSYQYLFAAAFVCSSICLQQYLFAAAFVCSSICSQL